MGLSKPNCSLSSAYRSSVRPRSPAITMIGSPGSTRIKAKEISVTPMKVGTKVSRRLRT